MKALIVAIFPCFWALSLQAQNSIIHHVSVHSISVHAAPNQGAQVVSALPQYENVTVVETTEGGWAKISYKKQTGYVSTAGISKGKAVIETYTARTGAMCKDGTTSAATGSGACSRHGGVDYWITGQKTNVRIVGR